MDLSNRLIAVANMVKKVSSIVDVGTDHGYIPIYLLKNNTIKNAVASDINFGPLKKAELNIAFENLESFIQCRLGGGLSTVSVGEVEVAVIAGMGGNLITEILSKNLEVFKVLKYAVLQPVQNPEVVRQFIYEKGYKILDEDICYEDNKFYEIIVVAYDEEINIHQPIYYEISKILLDRKNPILARYIDYKLTKYKNICDNIRRSSDSGAIKAMELEVKIAKLEEMKACF